MLYRQTNKSDIRDILFQLALIFAQITMGLICLRFGRYKVRLFRKQLLANSRHKREFS